MTHEIDIKEAYAASVGPEARVEVRTPSGPLDIITRKYVIEVKRLAQSAKGIEQVLAYSSHYPNHQPFLLTFGDPVRKSTLDRKKGLTQSISQEKGVHHLHLTDDRVSVLLQQYPLMSCPVINARNYIWLGPKVFKSPCEVKDYIQRYIWAGKVERPLDEYHQAVLLDLINLSPLNPVGKVYRVVKHKPDGFWFETREGNDLLIKLKPHIAVACGCPWFRRADSDKPIPTEKQFPCY